MNRDNRNKLVVSFVVTIWAVIAVLVILKINKSTRDITKPYEKKDAK